MRRVMLVFGAILALSVAAAAQDNVVRFAPPAAAAPSPQFGAASDFNWQLAIGYQYNRFSLGASSVNTNGLNASIVRFLRGGFGLAADVGTGFGNTATATIPNNLRIKTVFFGGGAHYSLSRESHFEPWMHALVGVEHVRFTQTANFGTANSVAWTLGGGVDLHLNPRTAVRGEIDYLGSRFSSVSQKHFQLMAGLVFNL